MSSFEHFIKSSAGFVMNCANTMASIVKVVIKAKKPQPWPTPQHDTCLILGNGPSLKDSLEKYPEYFQSHDLICVNHFAVSPHYTTLKPRTFVIIDPNFWTSRKKVITDALDALKANTAWPINLIVPYSARNTNNLNDILENKFITVRFMNYVVFKGFPSISHFFFRKNLATLQSRNVLIGAVFLGINMGYKRLEIFGADHSWHELVHVNDQNVVMVRMIHFYDDEEKITYLPFGKGLEIPDVHRIDESFDVWARVFRAYHMLKAYAASRNCKIYNASEKSYIDAFERIKINA
jgi:hypothetical protein